jgi:hypothetical protein
MSRDEDLEWPILGLDRDFADCVEEGEERCLGVVGGEEEEGVESERGISCKENRLVSGGATSAEPEAANCALTTSPRPANGNGNVVATLGKDGM